MHVDRIPNRTSPPAFLLRETYREDGKVKKRTLANITHWPAGKIEALRRLLRDECAPDLKLMRSLPHGYVAAALGMLRKLGLDDLLAEGQRQRARMVALVTALVVARLPGHRWPAIMTRTDRRLSRASTVAGNVRSPAAGGCCMAACA